MKAAEFLNPDRAGLTESQEAKLESVVKRVFQLRHCVVLLFLGNTVLCTYLSMMHFEIGGSDVQLFHDDHNQQEQKQFDGMFEAWIEEDRVQLRAYEDKTQQCADLFMSCPYYGMRTAGARVGSQSE